ncbi:MAG: radical SAM protein, partial [Xanthomonadales bacterium]|nr:radical SAM protein [Xanthomonadales bacterium]
MNSTYRAAPIKGRGTGDNVDHRFMRHSVESDHSSADAPRRPETTVTPVRARTIITRNQSPDVGFNLSVNPYQGCEHGCVYCFARPTHAYHELSPGLDFETRILAKTNAVEMLQKE